jgi:hypothetical protein
MRIPKAKVRNSGLVALLGIGSLLLVTAAPALAAQTITGAGAGTGWEYPPGFDPAPCGPLPLPPLPGSVPGDHFEVNNAAGTFAATNAPGNATIALYTGPSDVVIDVGTHVISAAGVGPSCAQPIGLVPITSASLTSPNVTLVPGGPAGHVACSFPTGTYARASSAVNFILTGTCSVKGNDPVLGANVASVPTTLTITGTMNPCDVPPLFLVENPECTAAGRPATAGSHLITTYAAAGVAAP